MFKSLTRITISLLLLLAMVPMADAANIKNIEQLDLKQYIGKVVYLDFWASWCKPCQKSFPWMNSLVERYPAEEFIVLTVNLDNNQEAMNDFLSRVPAQFDVYHDPMGTLAEKFQLRGMPTSYLFNKSGEVVSRHIGFLTQDIPAYEKEIESLF